jgi:hypothetical protein
MWHSALLRPSTPSLAFRGLLLATRRHAESGQSIDQNHWSEGEERCTLAVSSVKHGLVGESMRHTVLVAIFALSASAVLNFGCGSGAPPSANSFTEVYTKTIQPKCSNDFCHNNGSSMRYSALDLSSKVRAYYSLVGQPCLAPPCAERMRVVPGHPESSMMYLNIVDQLPPGTTRCGSQMPADTTFRTNGISDVTFFRCPDAGQTATDCRDATLPAEEQQRIYNWISEGAQDN